MKQINKLLPEGKVAVVSPDKGWKTKEIKALKETGLTLYLPSKYAHSAFVWNKLMDKPCRKLSPIPEDVIPDFIVWKVQPTTEDAMVWHQYKRTPRCVNVFYRKAAKGIQNSYITREYLRVERGYKCYICGKELNAKNATLDHVVPKAVYHVLGQSPWRASHHNNLQLCCTDCNLDKGKVLPRVSWLNQRPNRNQVRKTITYVVLAKTFIEAYLKRISRQAARQGYRCAITGAELNRDDLFGTTVYREERNGKCDLIIASKEAADLYKHCSQLTESNALPALPRYTNGIIITDESVYTNPLLNN